VCFDTVGKEKPQFRKKTPNCQALLKVYILNPLSASWPIIYNLGLTVTDKWEIFENHKRLESVFL